jgi:signal transduction histidine kinase
MGAALAHEILTRPFRRQTRQDTAYLLLGILTGTIAFAVIVAFWIAVPMLALTLLGLPIVIVAIYVTRLTAHLDRRRAAIVLGAPLPARYESFEPGFFNRLGALLRDRQTWKDNLWLLLAGPIGLANAIVVAMAWGKGIAAVTVPLWWWALPADRTDFVAFGFAVDGWDRALYTALIGIAVILVTPWLLRLLARLELALARTLLAPSREAELKERVTELQETRAAVVDAQGEQLQRIERDLHDGAQARLVALALELGRAREKLETSPDEARALITGAHEDAKTALRELRDLVRGIHPAVLADRGLSAALSAIAARSPVPVRVRVELDERLPVSVETAAYFVVTEGLANIAKHSDASQATVSVDRHDGVVEVEVADDGVGGADPAAGSGLVGLERRLSALDGSLAVSSPEGGGTILRAEIPCAS